MDYGLIGYPLKQSWSKEIHNKIAEYSNTHYAFEYREIPSIQELYMFLEERNFNAINVTIPYKEAVIPCLDYIDPVAKKIGAINFIVNHNGKLEGHNTDYYGLKETLLRDHIDPSGKKCLILGTGGTSNTAYWVLKDLGAKEIIKVSRHSKDNCITYEEAYSSHTDAEIVVNATPVGMYPHDDGVPLDVTKFKHLVGVMDVIYNPLRTKFVRTARENNINAASGLYMLVAQALVSYTILYNKVLNPDWIVSLHDMIKKEKANVVLIGMPTSGKTTIGKKIAHDLNKTFIDCDRMVEQKIGMTIKEYFGKHTEAEFREIESEVIDEIYKTTNAVISTGGGVILREKNIEKLKQNGKVFFLDRPIDHLKPSKDRPLSSDYASLKRLYATRLPIYHRYAEEVIKVVGSVSSVAREIERFYL